MQAKPQPGVIRQAIGYYQNSLADYQDKVAQINTAGCSVDENAPEVQEKFRKWRDSKCAEANAKFTVFEQSSQNSQQASDREDAKILKEFYKDEIELYSKFLQGTEKIMTMREDELTKFLHPMNNKYKRKIESLNKRLNDN